jgi:bacteriochlorophyll 4-vinyl reductase
MDAIPISHKTVPNKIAFVYLAACEEVLGENGVRAVLHYSGLTKWIADRPPNTMKREVDYAEFSLLQAAMERIYGPQAGDNLARRSGWATFGRIRNELGPLARLGGIARKALPLNAKLKMVLTLMGRVFSQISDQSVTVDESDEAFLYSITDCPVCWGRRADRPLCHATRGVLEQALLWISEGHRYQVREIACIAMGHSACQLQILKEPMD